MKKSLLRNVGRALRSNLALLSVVAALLVLPAAVQAQDYVYYVNADGVTITIDAYDGPGGAVVIPGMIDGKVVTRIGDNAFAGCDSCGSITSVTIPDSVYYLGDAAFQVCTSLKTVTIGNSVTNIGNGAFQGCESLTSISIPNSVYFIGEAGFQGCISLKNATIGTNVTTIGVEAFEGCYSLTSISIPKSLISIGGHAFDDCQKLPAITVDALNPAYSSLNGISDIP